MTFFSKSFLRSLPNENDVITLAFKSQDISNNYIRVRKGLNIPQPTCTCSKLTKEAVEKGMKYVQSLQ